MDWLHIVAVISLGVALICALIIAADIARGNRQHMWIMNVVWPLTALYAGPLALWAYFAVGRLSTHQRMHHDMKAGRPPAAKQKPFWQSVALGATHCGSGCTLGDIIAEWLIALFPFSLFGQKIFAAWSIDFLLAFVIGVGFQYFTIKPMRNLTIGGGIAAALKADTLSLTAWQIGMYGWMAIAVFGLFGQEIPKTDPVFWFMMQIAMLAGFATSYPVNWWLLRRGIKEVM